MLVHLLLISVRLAPYLILINITKPTRGASRLIDFENNLGFTRASVESPKHGWSLRL